MRPLDVLSASPTAPPPATALRTVLLMLAMAIGVAAVVVLTALGDGARRYVVNEFSSIGTNLVIVLPGRSQTGGFSPANVDHQHAARPDGRRRARTAARTGGAPRRAAGRRHLGASAPAAACARCMVVGTTAEFLEVRPFKLAQGTLPAATRTGAAARR